MSKQLADMNTEDFNTMRKMLSEIEVKLIQHHPLKQKEFYKPIQYMIFEAWQQLCNSEGNWLQENESR